MAFRKRAPGSQQDRDAISTELRTIAAQISDRKFAAALSQLDSVAATADLSAERKCQIAGLTGQVLLERGKFRQASEAFEASWNLAPDSAQVWFSAALGKVMAQLRDVEVEEALETGKRALSRAITLRKDYLAIAANSSQTLPAYLGAAPMRPSVAAFRIGQQFCNEGEPEHASWFFAEARRLEPHGACRARIAQARLALALDDVTGAYDLAKQALIVGAFQAKTLSAWEVLIAAGQRLGRTGIESVLATGLAGAAPPIRARAKLVIARQLRAFGDPAWTAVAKASSTEDPLKIFAAEFGKLRVADAPSMTAAAKLLEIPNLGPREWIGAAKALVAARLRTGEEVDIAAILADGVARFGAGRQSVLAHGLALVCEKEGQVDLALSLAEPLAAGDAKSAWLLARLHRRAGHLSDASTIFQRLSNEPAAPGRFRLLALIEWVRCVASGGGDDASMAAAAPALLDAAGRIDDYELLLDLARQMTQAPAEVAMHAGEVFARGEQLARNLLSSAEVPSDALKVLFKVSRRQADFGHYAQITAGWEALPARKRDWLWTQNALYWQYLALVTDAYRITGRFEEAALLAEKYLEDAATPAAGLAEIGIPHALSLLARGNRADAYEWFDWIAAQTPTHVLCSYAYYWRALRREKAGDGAAKASAVDALNRALGSTRGMQWKKELSIRARLLNGESVEAIAATTGNDETWLRKQLEGLEEDRGQA